MKEAPTLTLTALLELIEEARNAELCRDTETLRYILNPVWSDIESPPDFSNFKTKIGAELLRLCGVFMSFYGLAKNLKDYQLKGKDLLTRAVDQFLSAEIPEKAAEANINLSFCYWNLDEINNAEAILEIVENDFGKNLLNPVYLQLCVNRLMICYSRKNQENLKKGLKLIGEIKKPMEFCSDARLQGMFHTQAGILFTNNGEFEKGVFHHNEAIRFAEKVNNRMFVGMNLNNLAFLYKEMKAFDLAEESAFAAIAKFKEIGHRTLLAHTLDTMALIYLGGESHERALITIDEGIEIFSQGEEYRGWTEALWTKIKILLALRRPVEALIVLGELQQLANEKIDESAMRKFAENFSREIYILSGKPYSEEVLEFKKQCVGAALRKANGKIVQAAELLGLKSHKHLSGILDKQFPFLRHDLGFERRARRRVSTQAKDDGSPLPLEITLYSKDIFYESEISPISLAGKQVSYSFKTSSEQHETFYFDNFAMRRFGVDEGAVVAVSKVSELKSGMVILFLRERGGELCVGEVTYEPSFDLLVVMDEWGAPNFPEGDDLVGEPVGYCPFSAADGNFIEFARLKVK